MSRAEAAATITPAPAATDCDVEDCPSTKLLSRADPDAADVDARTLCPTHRVEYLREVAGR